MIVLEASQWQTLNFDVLCDYITRSLCPIMPPFFFSSFLHFLINRLGKDPCFATQKNTDKSVEIPKSQTIEFKPQAEQTLNDRKKAEADL